MYERLDTFGSMHKNAKERNFTHHDMAFSLWKNDGGRIIIWFITLSSIPRRTRSSHVFFFACRDVDKNPLEKAMYNSMRL